MALPLASYTSLSQQVAAFVQQHGFCTPLPPPAPPPAPPPPAPYETLLSLLAASHTTAAKRNHRHLLAQQPQRLARYEQGASIFTLARELQLPPTKVARDVLEGLLEVRRSGVRELLRAPEAIAACALRGESAARLQGSSGSGAQAAAARLLARLAAEVAQCVAADLKDSPLLDGAREWSGEEHEWRLAASMGALGLPAAAMLCEEELRHGAQRRSTPDLLLRWPIAVPCPHWRGGAAAAPRRLVAWLDSKASFADPLALDDSSMGIGRQVKKYLADYGPGMVVFWGGWVDSVPGAAAAAFGGGLVVHHRPPAAWRWATAEERAAAEAFRQEREEEELGEQVAAGEGGGGAAAAAAAAAPALQWEAAPEEGAGGGGASAAAAAAALRAPAAAAAAAAAAHHASWQAMLQEEARG